MEIKKGMYIRTKMGEIVEVTNILYDTTYNSGGRVITDKEIQYCIFIDILDNGYVKKASHNIIDLIEIGDLVNGEYIIDTVFEKYDSLHYVWAYYNSDYRYECFSEEDIETIITHEQLRSIEYKIKKGVE